MKQLMTGLLVSALLLVGGVPWAMAEGKIQLRQSDGSVTPLGGVGDAAKVTNAGALAGERRIDSATESYLAICNESNLSVISTTSAVTIGGGVASDTMKTSWWSVDGLHPGQGYTQGSDIIGQRLADLILLVGDIP